MTLVRYLAAPAAEAVNGQLFIVYGPTVTLLAAPTVEAKFTADSDAWDPSALNSTLADFFAGHDPKRTFSATALMVED
ncbi:Putative short chain dehydrogenase/reductase [Mycobacteroides abscessus subsp. abscessus]|uniref:Putative 3-ketoacyl-(Acyl-carrier-protein) reductase n=1 Tax=Mycobacteroides abscessus MAB_091912_2446 TaxID=1335414 RepID=A0A829MNI7_9MYCO|nr:putative 3-ketoacyl-(Acyl-carrier-protein) reductase [Mycobacteroides abscessus MAB_091912_2446]SHT45296.1 putative short-chain type dehydrogenase/reductase [Mycobacteroides abscessus subsp. abscessus]SIL75499.1 Putative short chain dehydrogenase/reductase [Mycobacteroides abscessus subsp. abscessus]